MKKMYKKRKNKLKTKASFELIIKASFVISKKLNRIERNTIKYDIINKKRSANE